VHKYLFNDYFFIHKFFSFCFYISFLYIKYGDAQ